MTRRHTTTSDSTQAQLNQTLNLKYLGARNVQEARAGQANAAAIFGLGLQSFKLTQG